MRGGASGVRKGAWTEEEDVLLRNCIARYGEGKWHKVPARAGLNRCRKSCRLRWLNYLKPDIKRGAFSEDEVDLIIRLHKLIGNRWSLIAGRIPGRTANDVKNYWNTHVLKKMVERKQQENQGKEAVAVVEAKAKAKNVVVKPTPRTFSKINARWLIKEKKGGSSGETPRTTTDDYEDNSNVNSTPTILEKESSTNTPKSSSMQYWWDNLFLDKDDQAANAGGSGSGCIDFEMTSLFPGELSTAVEGVEDGGGGGVAVAGCSQQTLLGPSSLFSFDSEFLDLLFSDN